MASVLRILDANANRTREALRVMEEAARFILDDAQLVQSIKQLRHDFSHAVTGSQVCAAMEAHRDTPGDVGTTITTAGEQQRQSAADVALAAGKRLSESLRAMEEYAKVVDPTLASKLEAMRYRGYRIEQQLNAAMASGRVKQWRLCVLISECLCPQGDWLAIARQAIAGGADCLQLREKDMDAGQLLARAHALVALARPAGVSVIINDRPDVALLCGADGVHLGQQDLPCAAVRKLAGRQLMIGVSTSCIEEAMQAHADGADYCGVGPMFNTTTKRKDVIVGPAYLKTYLAWGKLPHLAIGGITPQNLTQLIEAGAQGIAVSSAVCASADPQQATAKLISQWPTPR